MRRLPRVPCRRFAARLWWLVSSLLAPQVAFAAAPKLAVMPPEIEAGASRDASTAIADALVSELARQGFDVRPPRDIAGKLSSQLRACADAACAEQVQALLDVDYLVATTFFHMASADSVTVSVVAPDGVAYAGNARVDEQRTPAVAAVAALHDALAAQRRGPGPWLDVRGKPAGAEVLLNGRLVGKLPRVLLHIDSGLNHVIVRSPGYHDFSQAQEVSADVDDLIQVEVALVPNGEQVPSGQGGAGAVDGQDPSYADPPVTRGSEWNYVIGGAAIALGVALLVKPALTLGQSGECAGDAGETCSRTREFSSTATWHTVGGIAAVGAGVAWLIVSPIRVRIDAGPDRATLEATGHF